MTEFCVFQILLEGKVYCRLGNATFSSTDSTAEWACGGCIIPRIMANRPCIHIKPVKYFSLRGQSTTCFKCSILNIVMDEPGTLCPLCTHCQPPNKE